MTKMASDCEEGKSSSANIGNGLTQLGLRKRLEMSVFVDSTAADGHLFHDEGKTVEVAARGGVITVAREFTVGQAVLVVNPKTWERIACEVVFVERDASGASLIDVAFKSKSLSFWRVTFSDGEESRAEETNVSESVEDSIAPDTIGDIYPSVAKLVVKNRRILLWNGLALAVLLGLLSFFLRGRTRGPTAASTPVASSVLQDLPPEDARLIPGLDGYRLATTKDFDPSASAWLQLFGQQPAGIVPGAYSGVSESNAYILVGKDNVRRVVIVAGGQVRCDAAYRSIAIAARVPKDALQKIGWTDASDVEPEGDGLLIVGAANDPASGVVLLLSTDQVVPRVPVDFHLSGGGGNGVYYSSGCINQASGLWAARLIPVTYSLEAMREAVLEHASLAVLWPSVAPLRD